MGNDELVDVREACVAGGEVERGPAPRARLRAVGAGGDQQLIELSKMRRSLDRPLHGLREIQAYGLPLAGDRDVF